MHLPSALTRTALRYAGAFKWLLAAVWALLVAGVILRWWRPSGGWVFLLFLSALSGALVSGWARWRRERLIREGPLSQYLKRKLRAAYPHLTQKDAELVERGLRQFFLACLRGKSRFVAMPSQAVDAMWHEFILHTQGYRDWCLLALGRFLHHTPAEALGGKAPMNDGLRRAWYWACKDEAILPRQPTRLPLLFAIDAKLAIPGGFHYLPDCGAPDGSVRVRTGNAIDQWCAAAFGDVSADAAGDASSFGGIEISADGGDGGDGGGCGGGGD